MTATLKKLADENESYDVERYERLRKNARKSGSC